MKDKVILIICVTICLVIITPSIAFFATGEKPSEQVVRVIDNITGALIAIISVYFGKEKL